MTTTAHIDGAHTKDRIVGDRDVHVARAHGDETKPSWKTTELFVYLAAVIGVLIASQTVGDGAANNGSDYFAADKAWWYITLLTIGYMVSRGLAKAGSRSRDLDPRDR
ncbi:hypothetical protein [Actinoplanes siamensis]|uniref:Uncharacterized protein n=1 Tax=Actinoplanes siamensis TaxID=1223317 RepID=A0A919TKD3_9ACTN|nr:hypothetical protein [Actinoplanes siamensis]GIF05154.1 hypothetical protein Asi03nite_26920 [Actinoplanes siamensis]